ncbi:MAG: nucleotidyltransferase [Planctomycetes bacterium]|nr:nucleotidyltransferase [Planctomycetota bacterium]
MIQLPREFKEFLKLLNSNGVKYVVVGGYAVNYHGYARSTADMDIHVEMSEENSQKLVRALVEFGFDVPELKEELFQVPHKLIRFGIPPMRIEILTTISGVTFDECYAGSVTVLIEDVEVNFISRALLLKNKRAASRNRDLDDIEKLRDP